MVLYEPACGWCRVSLAVGLCDPVCGVVSYEPVCGWCRVILSVDGAGSVNLWMVLGQPICGMVSCEPVCGIVRACLWDCVSLSVGLCCMSLSVDGAM